MDMKAVGNGNAIVDFAGEGRRRIALIICEVLRQRVVGVEIEPV